MLFKKTQDSVIKKRSIYRFFAEVLFWLIICFIVWFLSAKLLNIPLIWLSEWVLGLISNGVIDDVTMRSVGGAYQVVNQQFVIHTNIPPPGEQPVFAVAMPLIYGYGLAMFAAMTLATPKPENKKWRDIGIAYVVFLFVQLFGIMNKTFMDLVFHAPPEISNYFPLVQAHLDILGTSYQISTLVMPPTVPLILWILFNAPYMETLIGHKLVATKTKRKRD